MNEKINNIDSRLTALKNLHYGAIVGIFVGALFAYLKHK